MEVSFTVRYHDKVRTADIPKLSRADRERVRRNIERKLMADPHVFGEPLRHSLRGYRKLRVGDYRVVFRIEKATVVVLCIAHRSIVYEVVLKRS